MEKVQLKKEKVNFTWVSYKLKYPTFLCDYQGGESESVSTTYLTIKYYTSWTIPRDIA